MTTIYDIGDRRNVANESVEVSPTLTFKMGTGGNNVPVVIDCRLHGEYAAHEIKDEGELKWKEKDCLNQGR